MKDSITIEQFDNGITIKADNGDEITGKVCLDATKEKDLGKVIWESVKYIMDKNLTNIVKMEIEYLATDET